MWSKRDGKSIRSTWMTDLAAAKGFRDDARTAARKGALRAPAPTTVRKAGEAWLAGARDGSIRTRSGDQFKPSTIRGYEEALRLRLYPELGPMRLVDLRRSDLQHMADRLLAEKCDASTIRNTFKPLQAICRRAITRDELALKGADSGSATRLPGRAPHERAADNGSRLRARPRATI